MVSGINHITLSVRELDRSFAFYTKVLGLRPLARWDKGAYLEAGEDWVCLSLDGHTRLEAMPEYTHVAFTVAQEAFKELAERLLQAGAMCWQQNRSPGESFYFLDPDGHKLEIHVANLHERLAAMRVKPPRDLVLY